jgi:glycosyltransferase involved in cell wall biosynthesis
VRFSTLILANNEAENLPRCLGALAGCDDIVVVDDYSTDTTREVAERLGARVVQRRFDTFAGQRNWALDTVPFEHEWVLHLDADEVVTPALLAEIERTIEHTPYLAFRIPSKMMFLGRWLRHAATYPAYQVRLGRNPGLRFVQVGHGQREDLEPARIGTLREPYLHHAFSKGLEKWFAKHNRYSTQEAEEAIRHLREGRPDWWGPVALGDPVRRRRALKELSFRLPCRPSLRFLYMYVLRRGFLDGVPGLLYCRMLAAYERMIVWKMREIRRRERGLAP